MPAHAPRRLPDVRLQHRRLQRRRSGCAASRTSSTWTASSGRGARWGSREAGHPAGQRAASPAWSATCSSPTTRRSRSTCRAHSARGEITTITYGAHAVDDAPDRARRAHWASTPGGYLTLICRPIPRTPILEIVAGLSARRRGMPTRRARRLRPDDDPYHARWSTPRATRSSSPARSTTRASSRRCASTRPPTSRSHRRRHESLAGRGAGRGQSGHRPRQRVQPVGRRDGGAVLHDADDVDRAFSRSARRPATRAATHGRGQPAPACRGVHLGHVGGQYEHAAAGCPTRSHEHASRHATRRGGQR